MQYKMRVVISIAGFDPSGGAGILADIKTFEAFQQVLARMQRMRFDDIDREMGVFGDPDYCVERVRALRREYQMDEFICYFNQGGIMDHATVRASMTLFAREVMPHCR